MAVTVAKDENIQSRGEEIASKQGLTGGRGHESRTGMSTAYKLKGHCRSRGKRALGNFSAREPTVAAPPSTHIKLQCT